MAATYMYVPASWVRPDTLSAAFAEAGFAVLNDKKTTAVEPILEDSYLTKPITGNLTVGFFSGQANASDGCPSRLDFKTARGAKLRTDLDAWAAANGVSETVRPSVAQGVDLVYKFIPMMYGSKVVRDILTRLWRVVTSAAKSKGTGLGQVGWVNAVVEELESQKAFIHARQSHATAFNSSTTYAPPAQNFMSVMTPPSTPADRTVPAPNAYPRLLPTPEASPTASTPFHYAFDTRNERLREEEATRKKADEELSSQIRNEATARAAAVQTEARARAAKDIELAESIRKEAAARAAADAAEAKARAAKDLELAANIRDEAASRTALQRMLLDKVRNEAVARATAVQTESQTRAAKDAELAANIRAEAAARAAGIAAEARARAIKDSELSASVRKEAAARAALQRELLDKIVNEAKVRFSEDKRIRQQVLAEEQARKLQDSKLQAQIAKETQARHEATQRMTAQMQADNTANFQATLDAVCASTLKEARTRSNVIRQEVVTRAAQTQRLQDLIAQEARQRKLDVASVREIIQGVTNGELPQLRTLAAELKQQRKLAEAQGENLSKLGRIIYTIVQQMAANK